MQVSAGGKGLCNHCTTALVINGALLKAATKRLPSCTEKRGIQLTQSRRMQKSQLPMASDGRRMQKFRDGGQFRTVRNLRSPPERSRTKGRNTDCAIPEVSPPPLHAAPARGIVIGLSLQHRPALLGAGGEKSPLPRSVRGVASEGEGAAGPFRGAWAAIKGGQQRCRSLSQSDAIETAFDKASPIAIETKVTPNYIANKYYRCRSISIAGCVLMRNEPNLSRLTNFAPRRFISKFLHSGKGRLRQRKQDRKTAIMLGKKSRLGSRFPTQVALPSQSPLPEAGPEMG